MLRKDYIVKKNKQTPKKKPLRDIHIERSTSDNGKRRMLFMTEILEKDGYLARAEKKYSYYVSEKDIGKLKGEQLKAWMQNQGKIMGKKPHKVSIRREFNQETGLGRTFCRTTGSFYVVKHKKVFGVAFMHTVRFNILGEIPA